MTLGELIERLKKEDPNKVLPIGFGKPHSYRGYYDQLAFEKLENVRIGDMLKDAEESLGKEFTGYKGGEYVMNEHTDIWLSSYGRSSQEGIGETLLDYMLRDAK